MFSKYKFNHEAEGDLLRVSYSGKIKKKEIDEIMNKIYMLIYKHNVKKILIDALGSDVKLEPKDILTMAKTHPPAFKRTKTAVVENDKKYSQYSLYQTITENQEIDLKFFNDHKEAEQWLLAN